MRQKLCDPVVFVRRQPGEHILEAGIRIMSVESGTLDQAHDGRRALADPQRACKQPTASANNPMSGHVVGVGHSMDQAVEFLVQTKELTCLRGQATD